MSPVEINAKALVTAFIGAIAVVFLLYSFYPSEADDIGKTAEVKQGLSWKSKNFIDIPPDVKGRAKAVKITESRLSFDVDGQSYTVFLREAFPKPLSPDSKLPVLFLHGANSNSNVWAKLKSLELMAAMGYHGVAVDLPGWGQSTENKRVPREKTARFLERFIQQQKLDRPVIVAPSMSGSYAIPYIMGVDPSTCDKRVRGFVPLAPVASDLYTDAQYHRCEIPTLIVYGDKDITLGTGSTNNLRNLANREIFTMKSAGHACYEERPDEWHTYLYNFMLGVEREEGIH